MENKEGKLDLTSMLIVSVVLFTSFAILVLGDAFILSEFPVNQTNASAIQGIADTSLPSMRSFNGSAITLFQCNVTSNASADDPSTNISNVSLFIQKGSGGTRDTAARNATINSTGDSHVTFNASETGWLIINFTNETTMNTFDEGVYYWFCEVMMNSSDTSASEAIQYNYTTANRSFIIDNSPPGLNNISRNYTVVNTSNSVVSTGDVVAITANFTDMYTTIHTVRLFVNSTGAGDNEVNITTDGTKGAGVAGNNTLVNLSYIIDGSFIGHVLNFTFQVNDSVNNINITEAVVFTVEGDGTGPGPINLSTPVNLANQTSRTAAFGFYAHDNNDTNFNCNISITNSTLQTINITNIEVVNKTLQSNSTSDIGVTNLADGSYDWNVTCWDGPGNQNSSVTQNFTIDNAPPVVNYFNITNSSTFNINSDGAIQFGSINGTNVDTTGNAAAQGAKIYAIAYWNDSLTRPLEVAFQFLNVTLDGWQTINTTMDSIVMNFSPSAKDTRGYANLTFAIPTGHNEFEGANISFRMIANDSVGNINNSATVINMTVNVNDTTAPTLMVTFNLTSEQLGERADNFTNISDTTPTIVWNISENNPLAYIAIQVDSASPTGDDVTCNLFKNYTSIASTNLNRNGSITIKGLEDAPAGTCNALTNGTHIIRLTAEDTWGNDAIYVHNFTVQEAQEMNVTIGMINTTSGHVAVDAVNQANITPYYGISFNATQVDLMQNMSWSSSCQATVTPYENGTTIFPFNYSSCKDGEANWTVTIIATDTARNSESTAFQFAVDDVGPTVTVHSPTDGLSSSTLVELNVSAFDQMSRVDSVGFYMDRDNYLRNTSLNGTAGGLLAVYQGENVTFMGASANFTGTHTIKFRVNDSLGNVQNSSWITFTQVGTVDFLTANKTIADNNVNNVSNVSFINSTGGLIEGSLDVDQTLELYMALNSSSNGANVTINFNGSAANWNLTTEVYAWLNDSAVANYIISNHTTTVIDMVYFNRSFSRFLADNNSYFGMVRMSLNATNIGGALDLWYFEDEGDVSVKTNITKCPANLPLTHSITENLPCWNVTDGKSNLSVDIFVPHFDSAVVLVNNSRPPSVGINTPASTQEVGGFVPNITVSSDAVSCVYTLNETDSSATNNISSTVTATTVDINKFCTWPEIRFKNGVYNITFNVTDTNGNVNDTSSGNERTFTVTDATAPNSGTSISSSVTSTTATVTISGVNESVNATVWYSSTNTTLTSGPKMQTAFSTSPSVSLTGLTAETKYYYNVTLYDYNGNVVENASLFSFTTSAAAAAAAAATSSDSGSSGGGVGGAAGAASNVQSSKAQVWSSVAAGTSLTMTVNKADIGITEVSIGNVANELSNVEIKASTLKDNPVSDEAAEKVYQYLQITKKNMKDEDVTGITLKFRVTKTWLSDSGLTDGGVALWRYKDNKWNMLSTTKVSSDETYVYYEAKTPGFSYFAIGNKVVAPEEMPEEEVTEEEAPPTEEVEPGLPTPKPIEAPSKVSWPGWATFLVIVIAGLIIYFVFVRKKKE